MAEENCHDLLGALSDYVDGTATDALCREIEQHLTTCPECQVVVDTLAQTISLYRALPDPDLPDNAGPRLVHRLVLAARQDAEK